MNDALRVAQSHKAFLLIIGVAAVAFVCSELALGHAAAGYHTALSSQSAQQSTLHVQASSRGNSSQPLTLQTITPASQTPSTTGSVSINNHTYALPENGELHTTVSENGFETHVDVSSSSNSSGNTSSSTSIQLHTDSSAQTNIENESE